VRARLDALLGDLAQALLPASVQGALAAWTEVSVEGLGLAGYVPFEALPLSSGQPLGLALPVTHLPSLGVATRLAERARAGPEPQMDLSVVAAPLDLEREPIPWGTREAAALSAWCRPGRFALFAGAAATPAALRAPATSGASWLLLVLHGIYDPGRERAAGILLGRDAAGDQARLFAEDLESLRVPPLVFLAVCGAARGPLRRGDDGITDLGGAFLAAGAEAVVLSPIDLLLAPTLALAQRFQAELARGATPAHALHRARCALAERGEYSHPYHYALLHLVGIGHRPVYPAPLAGLDRGPSPWPAVLLLAGLVLGAGVALRRLSRSWARCSSTRRSGTTGAP
jgi:CHAT domain-containing protein